MFKYFSFFLTNYRVKALFIVFISILTGLLEMLSVALVFPVLNLLLEGENIIGSSPSVLERVIYLYKQIANFYAVDELVIASLVLIIVAIASYFMTLIFSWVQLTFSTNLVKNTKENIFRKLMALDFGFFVATNSASILHVLFKSTESLSSFVESFIKAFGEVIKILFYLLLMVYISVEATLIIIIIGFFYFLLSKIIIKKITIPTSSEIRLKEKDQLHIIGEYTNYVKEIRVYLQEARWLNLYMKKAKEFAYNLRLNQFGAVVLYGLPGMIVIIAVGIVGIVVNNMSLGLAFASAFATIFLSGQRINGSISIFLSQVTAINSHLPNIKSVHQLLISKEKEQYSKDFLDFPVWDKLIFKNVSFSYNSKESSVLRNINLSFQRNTTTSIIGESGSGKSTIVDLLLKIYSVSEGGIYLDESPINQIRKADLWSRIGYVGQNSAIINGTFKENILFGRDFSDSAVIDASLKSGISDFIDELDLGYESEIYENGSNLSGGQKQRLMIARAILSQPEILILDEITSALDSKNEKKINDYLMSLHGSTTIIIITHNDHMTKGSDSIFRIENGNIHEV